jgi:hypothetical protein
MTIRQFWGQALWRAIHPSVDRASTLTTYVAAIIGIVLLAAGVAGGALIGWLVSLLPFGLLAALIFAGLFRGAYSVYHDEYTRAQAAAAKQDELLAQVQELKQMIERLDEQLNDPNKRERLVTLRAFIKKGMALKEWITESQDSEPYTIAMNGVPRWDREIKDFLESELPSELSGYIDPFGPPSMANVGIVMAFLDRRLLALSDILDRVAKGNPSTDAG